MEGKQTKEAYAQQEELFEDFFDRAVLGEDDEELDEPTEGTEGSNEEAGEQGGRDTSSNNDEGMGSGEASASDGSTGGDSGESGEGEEGDEAEQGNSHEEGSTEDEEESKEVDEGTEGAVEEEEELLEDPEKLLQRYKTLQGMWRSERKKREELERRVQQPQTQQQSTQQTQGEEGQQPQGQEGVQQQQEEDIFKKVMEEEITAITNTLSSDDTFKEIKEDFPEVAEAIESSVTKAVAEASARQLQRVFAILQASVAPVIQEFQAKIMNEHYNKIKSAHPDFEKYVESGELQSWIEQQPPRKKKYYEEIYLSGTPEEVIEMLSDFKNSLGLGNKPKPKQTKKSVKVGGAKPSKELEDMEDIPSRQRPVNSGVYKPSPDDFEAAFEEALKQS